MTYPAQTRKGNYLVSCCFSAILRASQEGDFITTQERNWIGTYEVKHLDYPEFPALILWTTLPFLGRWGNVVDQLRIEIKGIKELQSKFKVIDSELQMAVLEGLKMEER